MSLEDMARVLLEDIGEDPSREGLLKTPERFSQSIRFLTSGYEQSLEEVTEDALFASTSNDMVIIKDIEFYSLCEHHIIPFFGICHIGYIPNGKVLGFSKFARVVEIFSRRLQIQERLNNQIAQALYDMLSPLGIGVIMKAQHLCMMMRGVEKQNAEMITSSMLGGFRDNQSTRNEFLNLVKG